MNTIAYYGLNSKSIGLFLGVVSEYFVIPAKAGIQDVTVRDGYFIYWIPAYAGMTKSVTMN